MAERFRDAYTRGQVYDISGELLNKQARDNNSENLSQGVDAAGGGRGQFGGVKQELRRAPFQMGIATIIGASPDGYNKCKDGPNPRDGKIPPCVGENFYLARFSWFEHSTQVWQEDRETYYLDAGAYWEGRTSTQIDSEDRNPDLAIEGQGVYFTDASRHLTGGPGKGPVPLFKDGDKVPAYHDRQRGWLVPVVSPPDDTARASYQVQGSQAIFDATSPGRPQEETVVAFLEVNYPHTAANDWRTVAGTCVRVPLILDGEDWCDTRTGFTFFESRGSDDRVLGRNETRVRIRMVSTANFEAKTVQAQLHMYGAGRLSGNGTFPSNRDEFHNKSGFALIDEPGTLSGGSVIDNWKEQAYVAGRFRDQPRFDIVPGEEAISITHEDEFDRWVIGCEWSVTIAPAEGGFSESSQSSTSSASSMSVSMSSMSSESLNSSSSSSSHSSSSSSSIIFSHSSSSSSPLSPDSDDPYCCTTLVADVKCDEFGAVTQVCYQTICYPKPPIVGLSRDFCYSSVWCVPCRLDDGESSSTSSSSPTSESSQSEGLFDIDCPEVPLEYEINADRSPGDEFLVVQPRETMRLSHNSGGSTWGDSTTWIGEAIAGDSVEFYVSGDDDGAIFGVTTNTAPSSPNNVEFQFGIQLQTASTVRVWRGGTPFTLAGTTHAVNQKYTIRRDDADNVQIEQDGQVIGTFTAAASGVWRPQVTMDPGTTWRGTTYDEGATSLFEGADLLLEPDIGAGYWDTVVINNQLEMTLVGQTGAGTFALDQNTGKVSYTPTAQEIFDGYDVSATVVVCDGEPEDSSQSNESEISSESSSSGTSSTSTSSQGTSSSSSSSDSEVSSSSSSSSISSLSSSSTSSSSSSSSSHSSSSHSSSSSSSSVDPCAGVIDCGVCEPGTAIVCPTPYLINVNGIQPLGLPTADTDYWIANHENTDRDYEHTTTECSYEFDYGNGILGFMDLDGGPPYCITVLIMFTNSGAFSTWQLCCEDPIHCDAEYSLFIRTSSDSGGGEIDWAGASAIFNRGSAQGKGPCAVAALPENNSSSSSVSSSSSGSSASSSLSESSQSFSSSSSMSGDSLSDVSSLGSSSSQSSSSLSTGHSSSSSSQSSSLSSGSSSGSSSSSSSSSSLSASSSSSFSASSGSSFSSSSASSSSSISASSASSGSSVSSASSSSVSSSSVSSHSSSSSSP